MGAWGVKALESDEGLDAFDEFSSFLENEEVFNVSKIIAYSKANELLPEKEIESDFIYDHTIMVIAECIAEFIDNNKLTFEYEHFETGEEMTHEIEKYTYTEDDIKYLIAYLKEIINPKDEVHELYELWKDSNSFNEWKNHMELLINKLNIL